MNQMNQSIPNRMPSKKAAIAASQALKEKEYWVNQLSGELIPAGFPADRAGSSIHEPKMEQREFKWTGELFSRLLGISGGVDPTLHMILVAEVALLLEKYTGSSDIILAAPIDAQEVEGEFINTVLPLRIRLDDNMTFKELVLQARDTISQAIENQNYPIDVLLDDDLKLPFASGTSLFDVAVLLENIQNKNYIKHIHFNVVFSFSRIGECIKGVIEFNSALYNDSTIERMINHFNDLLRESLFNVDLTLSEISVLSEEERRQLLVDFNDTTADHPIEKPFNQLFQEQVAQTPERPAVKYKDKELTYRELNENANQLARVLRRYGIGNDRMVALLLSRSPEMMESMIAAWKAGGAYIPLDTQYPPQRIIEILKDSGTHVLITLSVYLNSDMEKEYNGGIIQLDKEFNEIAGQDTGNLDLEVDINSLAYVIYTSGSTGKPKGVMVEHIGMINHIWAKIEELQMTGNSIVAQNASHTFDISVWQFFAALVLGGKTVIYPDLVVLDPKQFITNAAQDNITILEVIPSYLSILLDTLDSMSGKFTSLTYLVVTGETSKPHLVKQWFEKFPDVKIVNAYGPTEASDDITHYMMDKPSEMDRVPIGRPLRNFNIHIVDKHMKLCPIGVKGEICVSGIGVGRGYLNNPELTNKKFLRGVQGGIFFKKRPPGHRRYKLYKTGDIGRWLPNGNIEFFGRKDFQVKIRGYRIELEEIESHLVEHPQVLEAVVMKRVYEEAGSYLYGYLVMRTKGGLRVSEIKEYLSERLPDYMIPADFEELAEMPLTSTGKIDRKALPEPSFTSATSMTYISEKMLAELKKNNQEEPEQLSADQVNRFFHKIADMRNKETSAMQAYFAQTGRECYLLTHSQKMIYFSEKKYAGTSCENLIYMVRYPKILNKKRFEQAINMVLIKNHAFRLRMIELEYESTIVPGQYIGDYHPYTPDYFDFSGENGEKAWQEWIDTNNKTTFQFLDSDLYYFAYIKFNQRASGYYLKCHHIVSDGWSIFLVVAHIDKIYNALTAGELMEDTPNFSYLAYISAEHDYFSSQQVKADMKFWHEYLHPLPEEVSLSREKGDPGNIEGKAVVLAFPAKLRARMHDYCHHNKTSIFKLLLSALSIYVSQVTGIDDFVIGTLNHNRGVEDYQKTLGTFIRFIPLRVKIDKNKRFHDFVKETGENVNQVLKHHQRYPFDFLINELREKTGIDPAYIYNINLIGHPDVPIEHFSIKHYFPAYEPTPLSIHINFNNRDLKGILELEWDYQVEQYSDSDIKGIHQGLIHILNNALDTPGKQLVDIQLLLGHENALGKIGRTNEIEVNTTAVERQLLRHEHITTAVVLAKNHGSSVISHHTGNNLYACFAAGKIIAEVELRQHLAKELAPYMIPANLIQLEKMPLNFAGEPDIKLLKKLADHIDPNYIAPRNKTEEKLLEIWQKELKVGAARSRAEPPGIRDNFFAVGGDSIKSISLLNRINKEFNVELKMVDLYINGTIEKLAEIIGTSEPPSLTEEYKEALEEMADLKEEFLNEL